VTTLYVGAHYEVSGGTIKKYYAAGGTRIAMRDNGTLRYLLTDHDLATQDSGSTSVVADAAGNKLSEMRYKPWGEWRSEAAHASPVVQCPPTTPTPASAVRWVRSA
jgi:hypothetical protein